MYILFEGVDTSGKSTQIELFKKRFPNTLITKEPGGTEFGEKIREIILDGSYNLSFESEMFLFLSDRAQNYKINIEPNKNRLILSDRGLFSGIAYAKANNESIDIDFLLELNRFALGGSLPDRVVLFKTDKELIKKRLQQKNHDNIEQRGIEYLIKVQEIMTEAIKKSGIKSLFVDSNNTIENIYKKIKDFLDD